VPSEPQAPVRGRHLEALRAVAANPGGLRHENAPLRCAGGADQLSRPDTPESPMDGGDGAA